MPNVVEHVRYVMSNVDNNNNKFWYGTLYDDASYKAENGRIGYTGQRDRPPKRFASQAQAENEFHKKCREKEKKGYVRRDVLDGATDGGGSGTTQRVVKQSNVADIALRQIESGTDKETKDLIRYFSKVNAHNICSVTTMDYDIDSGLFSTPCGIVTQDAVDEANELLVKMADYVKDGKHGLKTFKDMACSYLMLIPQKVGRKLDLREVFPDLRAMQQQKAILDALEASIQSVMSGAKTKSKKSNAPEEQVFSVKLVRVGDRAEIDRIRKKYKKTLHRNHACSHMDVKRVWSVDIETMKAAFESRGKKVGNIHEYWHGTRAANILSILKGGLIIPPSNASNVTGRMFGNGVYFSSESTKSLNYSYGYWGGNRDRNPFMFLADVAMGKYYVPSSSGYSFPKKGYDSTWAKAGTCVMNHEMIVYDVAQCNLTFLIEFE